MTKGMAAGIVRNIHTDAHGPEEKFTAIQEVISMETHNGITKKDLIETLRWILEEYL